GRGAVPWAVSCGTRGRCRRGLTSECTATARSTPVAGGAAAPPAPSSSAVHGEPGRSVGAAVEEDDVLVVGGDRPARQAVAERAAVRVVHQVGGLAAPVGRSLALEGVRVRREQPPLQAGQPLRRGDPRQQPDRGPVAADLHDHRERAAVAGPVPPARQTRSGSAVPEQRSARVAVAAISSPVAGSSTAVPPPCSTSTARSPATAATRGRSYRPSRLHRSSTVRGSTPATSSAGGPAGAGS